MKSTKPRQSSGLFPFGGAFSGALPEKIYGKDSKSKINFTEYGHSFVGK